MDPKKLKNLSRTDIEYQKSKQEKNSRRVKRLRLILPVIAVAALAVVLSWGVFDAERIMPNDTDNKGEKLVKNELLKPRFESKDSEGRPYIVTAERAAYDMRNEDIVLLQVPSGQINLTDKEVVGLNALRGQYDQNVQTLVLNDKVKLAHSAGYTLDTDALMVKIENGVVSNSVPVFIESQEGTLRAEGGMVGNKAMQTLRFFGPVHVVLKEGFDL